MESRRGRGALLSIPHAGAGARGRERGRAPLATGAGRRCWVRTRGATTRPAPDDPSVENGAHVSVTVVTDSAAGLPAADAAAAGIRVVSMYVLDAGRAVPADELDLDDFYERFFASGDAPGTSQPSPGEFAAVFDEAVASGSDVLAVLISAKMSGTYGAAATAADDVRRRHPDARIELVDSTSNSMQEAFAALAAAEHAAAGEDLASCREAALASVARSRFLFAPESLDSLARGGRIAAAAALVGSALRIVPILTAANGATAVAGAARTRTNAMRRMAALMSQDVERSGLRRAVVQSVARPDIAEAFAAEWIEPIAGGPVPIVPVPSVIGVHVGPAIGVAYETVDRLR